MCLFPHLYKLVVSCGRCAKARKLLGLLYRRFSGLVDSSCTIELYKTLIHPHLEYATPVWAPYLTKSIVNLENFQKFALKFCLNSWDAEHYHLLLQLANIPSLESGRKHLKLSTLYKIYHGQFYFPQSWIPSTVSWTFKPCFLSLN